jgi:hypothetical protein
VWYYSHCMEMQQHFRPSHLTARHFKAAAILGGQVILKPRRTSLSNLCHTPDNLLMDACSPCL